MSNSQTGAADPWAISLLTSQSIGVGARDARLTVGGLSAPSTGNTAGHSSGVFPGGTSGSGISNDLQVIAASGLTVNVNGGNFVVARAGEGPYLGAFTSTNSVTLAAANPSNPRIDYVVIRVRDPGVDGASTTETQRITVLQGAPAASPTEPTGQMTDGDLLLAAVTIGANATSITGISDRRVFVVARGGVGLKSGVDNRPGSYEGDYRDNLATNGLERWSGTAWEQVASPAQWTAFTPALYSDAGQVNLGTGGSAFGRYMVNGKIMHLRCEFRGVRPMNAGYGYITSRLPGGYYSAALRESHIHCKLNTVSIGFGVGSIWNGDCYIPNNSNIMNFYFPNASDNCTLNAYRVAAQQGVNGAGIPNVGANQVPDPLLLTCQGTIEIQ